MIKDPVTTIMERELFERITQEATKRELTPYEILVDCVEIGLKVMNPLFKEEGHPFRGVPPTEPSRPNHLPRPKSPSDKE